MALILDKTHTGVTSVDISGNTLTTGYTNLELEDSFGNIHSDPYMVIDNFIIDKQRYFIKVYVNIYKDEDARNNDKLPIMTEIKAIDGESETYNTYFSIGNMENENVFKAAYNFIQTEHYPSWKSDEV